MSKKNKKIKTRKKKTVNKSRQKSGFLNSKIPSKNSNNKDMHFETQRTSHLFKNKEAGVELINYLSSLPSEKVYDIAAQYYNNGEYDFALFVFEYVFNTASDINIKVSAAHRIAIFYTKKIFNKNKREEWINQAHALRPDGQSYDLLGDLQYLEDKKPIDAFISMKEAIKCGYNEDRETSLLKTLFEAIEMIPDPNEIILNSSGTVGQKLNRQTFFFDLVEHLAEIKDKSPVLNNIYSALIKEKIIENVKRTEIKNNQLDSDLKELYKINIELKEEIKNKESEILENNVFDKTRETFKFDKNLLKEVFQKVNSTYPEASNKAKDILTEMFLLKNVITNSEIEFKDWTSIMVYFSKAIENNLRDQLNEVEGFKAFDKGLGGISFFIQKNKEKLMDHFEIDKTGKLNSLINELEILRKKYRNGFVHKDIMQKKLCLELIQLGEGTQLLSNLRYL